MATETLRHSVVFKTQLGWFGLSWHEEALARVTMGHRTSQAAKKRLPYDVLASLGRIMPWQRDLVARLEDFAAGEGAYVSFDDLQLAFARLTLFQRRVLTACRAIRWGETRSYAELAALVGSPRAARAVGTVMAHNPFPIVIPCHRVVGSNHRLGGFSAPGGLALKQRLLANEDVELSDDTDKTRPTQCQVSRSRNALIM